MPANKLAEIWNFYEKAADETVGTDVAVIGLGLTGVTASMFALDEGAKVIAIEKASAAGGSSKLSGGFITAMGSDIQKNYGYKFYVDDYKAYYNVSEDTSKKKDEADCDAVRAMIERSCSLFIYNSSFIIAFINSAFLSFSTVVTPPKTSL